MTTREVLEKALELLGPTGENWTKGTTARDALGDPLMNEHNPSAVAWCMGGACLKFESPFSDYATSAAYKVLTQAIGLEDTSQIPEWNDAPGRTFAEVKAAFEKAIEQAQ